MKITADTNTLLRAVLGDDEDQGRLAKSTLSNAAVVAIPIVALCELVWVLGSSYKISGREIAVVLRRLLAAANVVVDRPAAEAGLGQLEAGGDFADGVIAYEGRWLGAETFVSFDAAAVRKLQARGEAACLLK